MPIPSIRFPTGPVLRSIADLDVPNLSVEEVRHVSTAQVVLADYTVIQADFPELNEPNLVKLNPWLEAYEGARRQRAVHALIDDWLIANAAWVSAIQAEQTVVNTRIVTDRSAMIGYRPPAYGRSLVVPVQPDPERERTRERWPATMSGLLDLKGAGVGPGKTPQRTPTGDGLEHLGTALKDYVVKRAVDAIFERELPTMWTVPIYAVLDLGFDVHAGRWGTVAAGMHVRRAHRRVLNESQWGQVYVTVSLEVERSLRKYGLTTASRRARIAIEEIDGRLVLCTGDSRKETFTAEEAGLCLQLLRGESQVVVDRADVQQTRDASFPPPTSHMYDFGTLRGERAFTNPLAHLGSLAASIVIWPGSDRFVQPDPDLCLPLETWRRWTMTRRGLKLGSQFRSGEISRDVLREMLEEPLEEMVDRWQRAGASNSVARSTA